MLLSVNLVRSGTARAVTTMLRAPDPDRIEGMRYAEAWLTADFRTGFMPSMKVTGALLIAAWDDDDAYDRFQEHPAAKPYRDGWQVRLDPVRAIGALPGLPDLPRQDRPTGDLPVAAFTRAKVRANRFPAFAAASADAEKQSVRAPGFLAGLTVMRPGLRIGTFTLWENAKLMRQYSLGNYPGGHREAMDKDRAKSFHHEMLFARFRPYGSAGRWDGRDPLAELPAVTAGGELATARAQRGQRTAAAGTEVGA